MSNKNKNQEAPVVQTQPISLEASTMYLNSSPIVRAHINTVEEYCLAMAPGVLIDEVRGSQWQIRLYNAIYSIVTLDDVGLMREGCDELLKLFVRHRKGALEIFYTQRFVERLSVIFDDAKLDMFTAFCGLFYNLCDQARYESIGKYQDYLSPDGPLRHLPNGARERLALYVGRLYQ